MSGGGEAYFADVFDEGLAGCFGFFFFTDGFEGVVDGFADFDDGVSAGFGYAAVEFEVYDFLRFFDFNECGLPVILVFEEDVLGYFEVGCLFYDGGDAFFLVGLA